MDNCPGELERYARRRMKDIADAATAHDVLEHRGERCEAFRETVIFELCRRLGILDLTRIQEQLKKQ